MTDEKTCFVIAPIGSEASDIRERSDTVFEEVIKDVVEDYGYDPKRSDHIAEPGIITNQIIEYVVESELVIADLTDTNPNVFYELAVRHSHQKPVIQLINSNQDIPFDVATQRTISIDLEDFSTTREAQTQIREQIEEIEDNDFEVENPVSVAGHIRDLRQSDEPEKQQLAEFTKLLNDISSRLNSLEKDLDDPENLIPPDYLRSIQDHNLSHPAVMHRIESSINQLNNTIERMDENDAVQEETIDVLAAVHDKLVNVRQMLNTDKMNSWGAVETK